MASQWLGALSPPPGVEPDFDHPDDQMPQNIALHATLLSLVTIFVGIRTYTRLHIMRSQLGVDDCLCLVSYCLSISFTGLLFKAYIRGIGRHMWDTPAVWVIDALKWFSIATYVYLLLGAVVKLTILFFYRRVFGSKSKVKWATAIGIVLVICLNGGVFLANLFSCRPIQRTWNPMVPGQCFNPVILPYLSGVSSFLTDLYVLVIPIPVIWSLNLDVKRRLRVMAVFGLGILACAASLTRLAMTPKLRSNPDATRTISSVAIWATVEVNVGIICSCLLLFPAFIGHLSPMASKFSFSKLWSYRFTRPGSQSMEKTEYSGSSVHSEAGYQAK